MVIDSLESVLCPSSRVDSFVIQSELIATDQSSPSVSRPNGSNQIVHRRAFSDHNWIGKHSDGVKYARALRLFEWMCPIAHTCPNDGGLCLQLCVLFTFLGIFPDLSVQNLPGHRISIQIIRCSSGPGTIIKSNSRRIEGHPSTFNKRF